MVWTYGNLQKAEEKVRFPALSILCPPKNSSTKEPQGHLRSRNLKGERSRVLLVCVNGPFLAYAAHAMIFFGHDDDFYLVSDELEFSALPIDFQSTPIVLDCFQHEIRDVSGHRSYLDSPSRHGACFAAFCTRTLAKAPTLSLELLMEPIDFITVRYGCL